MRFLRYFLILVLVTIAVWRLFPHIQDFQEFITLTKNTNWLWIILAIIAQTSQYIGDGWLSQLILKMIGVRIKLAKTLQIASLNVFAAHILPVGEAGVIATVYYFYKKLGVDNQSLIFLTIFWSASTGISLVIMLIASMLFLPKIPHLQIHISQIILYLLILLSTLAMILFAVRKPIWPKIRKLLKDFGPAREILYFVKNLSSHKETLTRNKILVLKSIFAGFIYYTGNILTLTFCFLAFGKVPSLALITFAYFISLLAGWMTLAPAGLGATEATMIIIFHEFGIAPALSLAAMLSFRLISFWLPIPAGFISYISLKNTSGPKPDF